MSAGGPVSRRTRRARQAGAGAMGEIADAMLDGMLCATCGTYIGESDGAPRYCSEECKPEEYKRVESGEIGRLLAELKKAIERAEPTP